MSLRNLGYYQSNFLKIIDKQGQLQSFAPNSYQQQLNKVIEEKRRHQEPIRIRVLKARQLGISTWGASLVYWFAATNFYKNSMIISLDHDSSSFLFEMSKRFWDYSPDIIKPMRKRSNAKELLFDNPEDGKDEGLKSSIRIETANKLSAGRSKTIQCLHMSESAFWQNAGIVQTGLFQSIPYSADTIVIDESTANGVAGHGEQFYTNWHDGNFTNLFFPWHHNPEYAIPAPKGFTLTHYEKELKSRFSLSNEQINYRRYKIENEMGSALLDPEDQFRQEMPLTPEEAFISSGRSVFNIEDINKDIQRAKQAKFKRCEI